MTSCPPRGNPPSRRSLAAQDKPVGYLLRKNGNYLTEWKPPHGPVWGPLHAATILSRELAVTRQDIIVGAEAIPLYVGTPTDADADIEAMARLRAALPRVELELAPNTRVGGKLQPFVVHARTSNRRASAGAATLQAAVDTLIALWGPE